MNNKTNDLDDVTVTQLLKAIKPAHLVITTGVVFSLIGGAFSFGIRWEKHRFDVEITPLKQANAELIAKNNEQKTQIEFYREKDKFISLTSTLQFQAILRGIDHEKLFTCSGKRQEVSDSHLQELFQEYSTTLEKITNPQNGRDPIAFYGPRSRACKPRLINFENDQSAAYLINSFAPTSAINNTR
ncbi:hypothetical protein LRP49_03995 [Enterovibrio sp. ZSDZ35]|uniref:Uncharacterized protein n=1 Tax=Enterovibrio qingdaonensis TaxID=2899818 RepID=A0ABT5QHA3_9GAMM|nr:hypothetical protein [Enterovibrio sp. ZSDZ35]MDD1780357.1 hypothetical protein [Enterovibrio sp. ZSDZ35]